MVPCSGPAYQEFIQNGAAIDAFVTRRSSAVSVFSWNTNEDVVNSRSSNGDLAQRADQWCATSLGWSTGCPVVGSAPLMTGWPTLLTGYWQLTVIPIHDAR